MTNYPQREAVIEAIDLIDSLIDQQKRSVPGVTDEVIRRAKWHASPLVERYTSLSTQNANTYKSDYAAHLRSVVAAFEAGSFEQAVSETRLARMKVDEWNVYQKMPFDAPNEMEQDMRRTLQDARKAFVIHFHRRPVTPWTIDELEEMARTGEFVESVGDPEDKGASLLEQWNQEE